MVIHNTTVNCVIVGDGIVGKTCLAKKFSGLEVSEKYVATIMDKFTGTVSAYGEQYKVNIKDTAGQYEDAEIRELIYKQSDACVVCYSVIDRDSLESVKLFWIQEIRNFSKKIPIILVATQTDLRKVDCVDHVSASEGKIIAKQMGVEEFEEISSFEGNGIKTTFEKAVKAVITNRKSKMKWLKSVFES